MVGVEGNPLVEGFSLILLLGCPSQEPKILLTVAVWVHVPANKPFETLATSGFIWTISSCNGPCESGTTFFSFLISTGGAPKELSLDRGIVSPISHPCF